MESLGESELELGSWKYFDYHDVYRSPCLIRSDNNSNSVLVVCRTAGGTGLLGKARWDSYLLLDLIWLTIEINNSSLEVTQRNSDLIAIENGFKIEDIFNYLTLEEIMSA